MRLRSARRCEHAATVTTVTAGIERTVCEGCGEVRISYDHRTCTTYSQGITTRLEYPTSALVDKMR